MGDNGHEVETDRVIGFCMRAFDMKHPAIAQVEAYWDALRGDRQVPLRAEIDPRGIDQALENAFILERIAPKVARFRLAGMHLNELMGMETRGMPMTALFEPAGRGTVTTLLEHVFEQPAKVRLRLGTVPGTWGHAGPAGEMLLMPLRSDLGDISRALGCLVTDGMPIGRAPHRFTVAAQEILPLDGTIRSVTPAQYPRRETPRSEPARAMRENAAPFDPAAPGTSDQPPYLRLVHDSDRTT